MLVQNTEYREKAIVLICRSGSVVEILDAPPNKTLTYIRQEIYSFKYAGLPVPESIHLQVIKFIFKIILK